MKKASRLKTGRAFLQKAKSQWDSAAVHSYEPADPGQCVSLVFYSFENAVVAAAEAVGYEWEKKHASKAKVAHLLVKNGKLKTDVSHRLTDLNRLRKDVSYGEPGAELSNVNLEDLISEIEQFTDEVDELLSSLEDEEEEG